METQKPKVRWAGLALKELRETLRDRRTVITLILMPLLVYPILSLVFRTFLTTNAGLFATNDAIVFQFVYDGDGQAPKEEVDLWLTNMANVIEEFENRKLKEASGNADSRNDEADNKSTNSDNVGENSVGENNVGENKPQKSIGMLSGSMAGDPQFAPFKTHRWYFPPPDESVTIESMVEAGEADLAVHFTGGEPGKSWPIGGMKLISTDSGISRAAARYLEDRVEIFNKQMLNQLLRNSRLPTEPAITLTEVSVEAIKAGETESASPAREGGAFSLASLIPLILVLMTITGAVYPAIDLTAGEKERGTLETLMAAPIPRLGILFSKFVAVMTVAVLTALLNMIGMAATIWAFQLDQFLTGAGAFTPLVVFKIFLLLVLFAAFFSALLLAVTSYARSFKEAQAYLIPIILCSMGPGLLAMTPGLTLNGTWSVTPMVNILLLARDVIQNEVVFVPACIAIISTALYAVLALVLAARSFGSDAILYSTHGSFGEMFARPNRPSKRAPLSAVTMCVVLLFPINFVMIGFLGRMPSETAGDLSFRFMAMGAFTMLSFMVFPWLVARHQRTETVEGFGLKLPRIVFFVAAIMLGLSLWPLVISLVDVWHELYGMFAGAETRDAWHDRLVQETSEQVGRIRQIPPWMIAMSLSIIPAICEEWFFRGMLLRSLAKTKAVWVAITVSAIVFGLFHVLSNSVIALDRLIPTTLVGFVLGYIAWKSDSIWPGVLLHSLHNAAVSFLAYYQPTLSSYDWFPKEEDPIPGSWVAIAAVVAVLGVGLMVVAKRDSSKLEENH